MNSIFNRAVLLNAEPYDNVPDTRPAVLANTFRSDDQRKAFFARQGGGDSHNSVLSPPRTLWEKYKDSQSRLADERMPASELFGLAAGMVAPAGPAKAAAAKLASESGILKSGVKELWDLARVKLAGKLGLTMDLRKGVSGVTENLDNLLSTDKKYGGLLKQAASDFKNGDRALVLPFMEQKVAPVADRMAATRIQGAVKDAERLAESIPAGHYDTALDLADKRVIDAIAAGDAPTKQYLEELWWDKKDLFRDPSTSWVNYNEMADYLTDVVSGAGKSRVVSGMPAQPLASLKAAEKLGQARQTVADLRAAYRHKEADAVIRSMGDAWPNYTGKISTAADDLDALRKNPYQAWEDQYGNRAAPVPELHFLANALSVAREDVLANAIQSDSQRRAVFAKMRYTTAGGSTGSASQGGGSSRQVVANPQTASTKMATFGGVAPVARGIGPLVAIPANPNAGKMVASATRETVAELRMTQAAKAAESALQAYGPTSNQYIDALERSIAAREAYQKTVTPKTPTVEDLMKSALAAIEESKPVAVQPVKEKEQVVTTQPVQSAAPVTVAAPEQANHNPVANQIATPQTPEISPPAVTEPTPAAVVQSPSPHWSVPGPIDPQLPMKKKQPTGPLAVLDSKSPIRASRFNAVQAMKAALKYK